MRKHLLLSDKRNTLFETNENIGTIEHFSRIIGQIEISGRSNTRTRMYLLSENYKFEIHLSDFSSDPVPNEKFQS